MFFLKKKQKILKGENRAFLPFLPRSKDDNDDVNKRREKKKRLLCHIALHLTLPHLLEAKETDRFLPRAQKRAKEESFKKYSKKQPFFQQQKINKKGVNYLDRISLPRRSRLPFPVPSRLCSLYARACVVSGRTVSVLQGGREREKG